MAPTGQLVSGRPVGAPMMFIKKSPNSHGFVNPRDIESMWRDQFDWVYREYDEAVFPMTIHPDVSGRPQVLLMLERITEFIQALDQRGSARGTVCRRRRTVFGPNVRPEAATWTMA